MLIGLTVWNGRVSPVFDTARALLLVTAEGGREEARREVALDETPEGKARQVAREGVGLLVCGALSRLAADLLAEAGVRVEPFVSGGVEEVLRACAAGEPDLSRFAMPGCRCRHRGAEWWRAGGRCPGGHGSRGRLRGGCPRGGSDAPRPWRGEEGTWE